jgi:DNA-binding transcriptional MerR regulator
MEYRVEELARAAGVGVDTIRFYQARGILPAPERRGRIAIYTDDHLERMRRIRSLNRQGLTLEAAARVLDQDDEADQEIRYALLGALRRAEGEHTYTRAELASTSGIPEPLLETLEEAGLLTPPTPDGEKRYTDADRRSAEAVRTLLDAGLPAREILPLARRHDEHVTRLADEAVELFGRYVRHKEGGADATPAASERVIRAFQELLPAVTTLVAHHFQRTLIERARVRLAADDDARALDAAMAATGRSRLVVSWE